MIAMSVAETPSSGIVGIMAQLTCIAILLANDLGFFFQFIAIRFYV